MLIAVSQSLRHSLREYRRGSGLSTEALALRRTGRGRIYQASLLPFRKPSGRTEQKNDSVTIRTDEGLMTRPNISRDIEAERVVIEFDEKYEAGSKITATSHFAEEFTTSDTGVTHRLVMIDAEAPGFLDFFSQRFGNSKMGNTFLEAYKQNLEEQGR